MLLRRVVLAGMVLVLAGACRREPSAPAADAAGSATRPATPATMTSADGTLTVSWTSDPAPIPLNGMFALDLRVEPSGRGRIAKADAGMPGHGHGMTLRPSLDQTGEGRWRAAGFLFHMPGEWEIAVTLARGDQEEVLRFPVVVRDVVDLSDAERAALLTLSPKPPLPPDPTNRFADDPCAQEFGRFLFFDPRFSQDGSVACATCHVPALAFTNGQALGRGMGTTARHVPTIWNSAYNRWFFWDGRADSAWSQSLGPMESSAEHGTSRVAIARVLFLDEDLRRAYESLFGPLPPMDDLRRFPENARPDPWERWHPHAVAWKSMTPADQEAVSVVAANVGKSIAAYERTLVGGDAPFDRFVASLRGTGGSADAISAQARRGARLFVGKARCTTCHHGPLLTDFEFHDLHLVSAVLEPRDTGRFRGIELLRLNPFNAAGPHADSRGPSAERLEHLVQQPENWGQFKTPSLRNVARTAPYMHDGRFATLSDVLHYYRTLEGAVPPSPHAERTLQKVDLTDDEASDLLAFLESLSEDLPDPAGLKAPEKPLPPGCGSAG